MKKIYIIILAFILIGCSNKNADKKRDTEISSDESLKIESTEKTSDNSSIEDYEIKGEFIPRRSEYTKIENVKIGEENLISDMYILDSGVEGKTIFIVAGIHGDEIAGVEASEKLKSMEIQSGKVYIISPVNKWGYEKEKKTRETVDGRDINRNFPGDENGDYSEKIANIVYSEIKKAKPDIVIDCHEAEAKRENRDYLGSSLIFTSLDKMENLFFEIIDKTEKGELASEAFSYYSPGVKGSINEVVTNNLKIPVITIETFREYELDRRVGDQLAIIGYILRYFEIINY